MFSYDKLLKAIIVLEHDNQEMNHRLTLEEVVNALTEQFELEPEEIPALRTWIQANTQIGRYHTAS